MRLPPALDKAAPPSLPGMKYVVVDLPSERLGAVVKLAMMNAATASRDIINTLTNTPGG